MKNFALLALLAAGAVVNAQVIYNEGFESLANGTSLNTYNPGVGTPAPWQANVNVKATTAQAQSGTTSITRDYSLTTTGTGGDIWKVLNFNPGAGVVKQQAWIKLTQNVGTLSTNQLLQTSLRTYAHIPLEDSNPFIGAVAMFSWQDTDGDDATRGRCWLGMPVNATGYNHFSPTYRATYVNMTEWNLFEINCDYRTGIYSAKVNGRDIGLAYAWNYSFNPIGAYPQANHGMFTMQPLRFLDSGAGFASSPNATDHSPFFDGYKTEVAVAKPISGRIDFESIVGYAVEDKAQNLIVTIMDSAGNVLEEGTTLTDADGDFDFSATLPDGTYKVQFKAYKWLSNSVASVSVSASGTNVGTIALAGADGDENNLIDIADYGILANAFDGLQDDGTGVPSAQWDFNADFDCNGIIDIADYGILASNFDKVGL